jgi:processive 1,2-diacylglycerol beta-glucosyltransferase
MWVHQGLSGYFVANEELAYRLRCNGIAADRILVSGIPVMPGFRSAPDRRVSAHRFGLDANRLTILMMGGGAGVGDMESIAKQILALNQDCQLIVLAGKNQELYQSLLSISAFYPQRLYPMGFTQEVDALMACSDLAITKPGGLSTSECLVMGLPMLLVNPIPGQEERNAAILLQEGVAIRADDADSLVYRLQKLLANQEQFALMKTRAQALAKPDAAKFVLNHVIQQLPLMSQPKAN